jgi:hypothetical protein
MKIFELTTVDRKVYHNELHSLNSSTTTTTTIIVIIVDLNAFRACCYVMFYVILNHTFRRQNATFLRSKQVTYTVNTLHCSINKESSGVGNLAAEIGGCP